MNELTGNNFEAESPHAYPILCDNRDEKLIELEKEGIEARTIFSSLPTQESVYKYLGYKLGDFPVAEDIGRRGLFVPIHQDLTDEDLEKIARCLK